jgi:hypothetical protein
MLFYGHECLTPLSISTPTSKVEGINKMIAIMQHTLRLIKESMHVHKIKLYFTWKKICTPQEFEVND